ncbi:uncharacterized protein G2W53_003375 [Senna tora]|uniref:Uncharacterized protein n=1 Tax=Senna tora TaxID=362788 RepID=A0A834XAQ8_9FABA|nr:uncharacterized protein G2W53_003375 [Senna tora]
MGITTNTIQENERAFQKEREYGRNISLGVNTTTNKPNPLVWSLGRQLSLLASFMEALSSSTSSPLILAYLVVSIPREKPSLKRRPKQSFKRRPKQSLIIESSEIEMALSMDREYSNNS